MRFYWIGIGNGIAFGIGKAIGIIGICNFGIGIIGISIIVTGIGISIIGIGILII